MQVNQAIKNFLNKREIIAPFATELFHGLGQEVRSQDSKNILLPVQSPLAALRKSWVICPNNGEMYASIFFHYIDAKIQWPFGAEEPVLSIYHRIGGWPSESALIIIGTHPRAFPDITEEVLAKAKHGIEVEVEEFVDRAAEQEEPYDRGDGVAFREYYQITLTENLNRKVFAKKIVNLGQRIKRDIFDSVDATESDLTPEDLYTNMITASLAIQSDL